MSEKRKRVSFWESESKEIRDWCKAQANLGTSLDLIIADAIQAYGKGDVIKAYLSQRMMDMQSQRSSHYVSSQEAAPTSETVPTSSSPSRPSNSETHQLPSDSAPIGNMIRQEATLGPREQGDPSIMAGVGDMIREEAISGSREEGNPSETEDMGDIIRREATSGAREQEDPSNMGGITDMIRREATSTSSPAHNNGGERQGSNTAKDSLSVFLGDSGSRLDR
ncbi:hypothetical protein [Paenibacillus sp. Y412MC10]|uniref:hypothetical protein n=1 Tax=Geobacillus sp. (strain Y412MC10) TaxID=481743 RepID=UPI00119E03D3|nr:hypothetical protein [Paenibacillus sp. Y412MC10]